MSATTKTTKTDDSNFTHYSPARSFRDDLSNVLVVFYEWAISASKDNEKLNLEIVFSLVEFWKKKNFLSINQVAILEKIYWKFGLNKLKIDDIDFDEDEVSFDLGLFKQFFATYKIADFAGQPSNGQNVLTKKSLYSALN